MLIPVSSVKLAFWSRMLYGNKKKGESYLSNQLMIESWAKEAVDDGAMAAVIYDPQTPNGSALVDILENAGYGDRALNVLFMMKMDLGMSSDWSAIVSNAGLMESIFGNPAARQIVFSSASALNAVAGSGAALQALFGSEAAVKEMWSNDYAATTFISNSASMSAISDNNGVMDALLASTSNWGRVLSQTYNISAVIGNVNFRNRALNNTSARVQLFNNVTAVNAVIADSAAVNYVLADAGIYNTMFSSSVAMGRVILSGDIMNSIINNNTVYSDMLNSVNAMTYAANSATVMDSIININTIYTQMMTTETSRSVIFANTNAMNRIALSSPAVSLIISNAAVWAALMASNLNDYTPSVAQTVLYNGDISMPMIMTAGVSKMDDILSNQASVRALDRGAFRFIYDNAAWRARFMTDSTIQNWIDWSKNSSKDTQPLGTVRLPSKCFFRNVTYKFSPGTSTQGYITIEGAWLPDSPKLSRYPASGDTEFWIDGYGDRGISTPALCGFGENLIATVSYTQGLKEVTVCRISCV